ncbi:hypothetical protein [Clostridium sp.]|uniref:hypothetical protein n=1 Tax=Clostridium sp. TaxID=1506 RepID=UPI001A4455EF|nr:hypothetical protein [Clostridium sp.]MBK5242458.1 hypothetical protein [Clostridium sp.]
MDIFFAILKIIAGSIVMLLIYYGLKAYVLPKIKVNKWIVLTVAMLVFIVPMLIWPNMPGYVSAYVIPGIFVVLFLWFLDLSGFIKKKNVSKTNYTTIGNKKDNKKDVVIRPKAKPNRVKNNVVINPKDESKSVKKNKK